MLEERGRLVVAVFVYLGEGVGGGDDEGGRGDGPFEGVEFGGEGVSHDEVVVDEEAGGGVAGSVFYAPAEDLAWAR